MNKVTIFIDETGQDTNGHLFILAMVVAENELEELRNFLIEAEQRSGKLAKKWQKTRNKERQNYIKVILESRLLRKSLFFEHFANAGKDYLPLTIYAIANLFQQLKINNQKVSIIVDALNKKERAILTAKMRGFHFKIDKIVGKRDQSDPILRLADALAGFVRDGIEKHSQFQKLFEESIKNKKICKIK